VVGVDVRDDRDVRPVEQERAVALVRLHDEVVAGAVVPVGARLGDLAADDERRVLAGLLQDERGHRRGRGLAVRAGHRDRPPSGHRRGERLGAVQHAQAAPPRLDELQVVLRDRGGVHDGVHTVQVGRLVCHVDGAAERAQPGQRRPLAQLAAGDRDAAGEQEPGQPTHAHPADPDEVDRTKILGGELVNRRAHCAS
jgi:hypothetical protein